MPECHLLHRPTRDAARSRARRAQSLPAQGSGTHATLYEAKSGWCCGSEHPNVKPTPHFTLCFSLPRFFARSWAVRDGSHCPYGETRHHNAVVVRERHSGSTEVSKKKGVGAFSSCCLNQRARRNHQCMEMRCNGRGRPGTPRCFLVLCGGDVNGPVRSTNAILSTVLV